MSFREKQETLYVFKGQECMVRAWEGLNGLEWEAEKRQQGKATEVNSIPGSLIASWHGSRNIV